MNLLSAKAHRLGLGEAMESQRVISKPRLNQCYLCKTWHLGRNLSPIEVPDQAGYIQKLGCKKCLDEIMAGSGIQDVPQQGKGGMEGVR